MLGTAIAASTPTESGPSPRSLPQPNHTSAAATQVSGVRAMRHRLQVPRSVSPTELPPVTVADVYEIGTTVHVSYTREGSARLDPGFSGDAELATRWRLPMCDSSSSQQGSASPGFRVVCCATK